MTTRNVLLLGRTAMVLGDVRTALDVADVELFAGTTLEDVRATMDGHQIDIVIMGAGLDLETRLDIVRHVFSASTSTTVHMKDRGSGPTGMLPFVKGILEAGRP